MSRVTLRLAIDELVARGLVTRSQGRGSFVRSPALKHDMLSGQGFFDALLSDAAEPEARLLGFRHDRPPSFVAKLFGLETEQLLPRIERLYLSAGKPVGTSFGWLPSDAYGLTRQDVRTRSTATIHAEILRRPVVTSTTQVSAAKAGTATGRVLRMDAEGAVLVLTRSRFDGRGELRDHSRFTLNPAFYQLTLTTGSRQPKSATLKAVTKIGQ